MTLLPRLCHIVCVYVPQTLHCKLGGGGGEGWGELKENEAVEIANEGPRKFFVIILLENIVDAN